MSFWDRFVLWVYAGFADTVPVGRDAAASLFAAAYQQGRLVPAFLNDLSLLVLMATVPVGSPVHAATGAVATIRRLPGKPIHLWELLQSMRPDRLTELLELGRSAQPAWRAPVATALLRSDPVPNLCDFLGRLFLVDPDSRRFEAEQLVLQAAKLYLDIPPGTLPFRCRLYRHVLHGIRQKPDLLPSILPPGESPPWLTALDADEQMLIRRGLEWLSEPDLTILYLHFYAHLDAETIACVLNARRAEWKPDDVATYLEACWLTVLS